MRARNKVLLQQAWLTLDEEKRMLWDVVTKGGVNENGAEYSLILHINDE